MKKTFLSVFSCVAAATLLVACGRQQPGEMGGPGAPEYGGEIQTQPGQTVVTNLESGAVETSPGAGSAVGGDPAGAGTAPLRDRDPAARPGTGATPQQDL